MREVITYDKDGVKLVEIIYEGTEEWDSGEVKAARLNVCSTCSFNHNNICTSPSATCPDGCIVEVVTSFTGNVCPEGKW